MFDLSFLIILFCIYECFSIATVDITKEQVEKFITKSTNKKHFGFGILCFIGVLLIIDILYCISAFILLFTSKWYIGFGIIIIAILEALLNKKKNSTFSILLSILSLAVLIMYFV